MLAKKGLGKLLGWTGKITDPLFAPSAAAQWLRRLPDSPPAERARAIVALFAEPRPDDEVELTPPALEALFEIDGAASPLVAALTREFVRNAARRDERAVAAWAAASELVQALGKAYRPWVDEAANRIAEPETGELLAAAGTRYLHYRAEERRLRALRHEQWIPGKWRELFAAYEAVRRLGGDKRRFGPARNPWPTAQDELVRTLLHEMLHRGSFGAAELAWALRYMQRWVPRLELAATTPDAQTCWVDLQAGQGLRRPGDGGAPPRGALYLDIRPVVRHVERCLATRTARGKGRRVVAEPAAAKLLGVLQSFLGGLKTRAPRKQSEATARVVVGLDPLMINLAFSRGKPKRGQLEMGYELRRPLARFVELDWPPPGTVSAGGLALIGRLRDISDTGVRLSLPAKDWALRSIGELIGVQEAQTSSWRVGVVRRLVKPRVDDVEVGIELLTTTPTWVQMADVDAGAERPAAGTATSGSRAAAAGVTTGVAGGARAGDAASAKAAAASSAKAAAAVYGIFVPPGREPRPGLLLASAQCIAGRRLDMVANAAVYRLAIGRTLERGAGWTYAEVRLLEKRAAPPGAGGGEMPAAL